MPLQLVPYPEVKFRGMALSRQFWDAAVEFVFDVNFDTTIDVFIMGGEL